MAEAQDTRRSDKPFDFLALPKELRLMVYEVLFSSTTTTHLQNRCHEALFLVEAVTGSIELVRRKTNGLPVLRVN